MSGKVLVACERSQVVCSAFRSFGVEAFCSKYSSWTFKHSSPTVCSRTFPGISHAMAMQWRGFVET